MGKISNDNVLQKPSWRDKKGSTSAEMWQEFADNTTLHGIRYVFMKRHLLFRLIWLVLLLSSGGYYIFTVYRAFNKFYSRPINTVIKTKHINEMDFPAVTICSLNLFAKSKLFMTDNNPLFLSSGLNISTCAATSGVRGNIPCGVSVVCCCAPTEYISVHDLVPNCTVPYRQDLLDVMKQSSHSPDLEAFIQYYSQDLSSMRGPSCTFGWDEAPCTAKDFTPMVTEWGMCYTFNSGNDGKIRNVDTGGVSSGLSFILDTQIPEYTLGKFSEGFKVLVHGQGEYVDEWDGFNVGPGQHAVIAISQKRFKNLEKPYATNCTQKKLKTFSTYTSDGCLYECAAEKKIKLCGCRPIGYKGAIHVPVCYSRAERNCSFEVEAIIDNDSCDCQVPCTQTKYTTEVSYSRFPDPGTAEGFVLGGFYDNVEYQRNNLVLLQVGFKQLSYDIQEQEPAYDSNSLFGEIGGNMGLFLGCSLLTICEFIDFFIGFLAGKRRQLTHPA